MFRYFSLFNDFSLLLHLIFPPAQRYNSLASFLNHSYLCSHSSLTLFPFPYSVLPSYAWLIPFPRCSHINLTTASLFVHELLALLKFQRSSFCWLLGFGSFKSLYFFFLVLVKLRTFVPPFSCCVRQAAHTPQRICDIARFNFIVIWFSAGQRGYGRFVRCLPWDCWACWIWWWSYFSCTWDFQSDTFKFICRASWWTWCEWQLCDQERGRRGFWRTGQNLSWASNTISNKFYLSSNIINWRARIWGYSILSRSCRICCCTALSSSSCRHSLRMPACITRWDRVAWTALLASCPRGWSYCWSTWLNLWGVLSWKFPHWLWFPFIQYIRIGKIVDQKVGSRSSSREAS